MNAKQELEMAYYADRDLTRAQFDRLWNKAWREEHWGGMGRRIVKGVLVFFTLITFLFLYLANHT